MRRLRPPTIEENSKLDEALAVERTSRLSCQILMSPELDGLRVRLTPGSERERSAAVAPALDFGCGRGPPENRR